MTTQDLREAVSYGFKKGKDLKVFNSKEFEVFKDYLEVAYPSIEKRKYKEYFEEVIAMFGDAGVDNIENFLKDIK